jgi:predicted permease
VYASRWLDIVRARYRSLFRRPRVESELDREMRFHVEQQIAENLASGMPPDEARLAALRTLGGVSRIQEECRDMRRTNHLEECLRDLRYAARTLVANPSFSIVVILTMALSIGANTAIFSVIDGVLLRSLPYRHADRLVRLFLSVPEYPKFPVNPFDFRDYRERAHSFDSLAAYTHSDVDLSGEGEPVRLSGFAVTSGFFRVLGVTPLLGREFSAKEELPKANLSAILSYRIWRSRFGGRANIIGQKLNLSGRPITVIGVLPPGVEHPGNMYRAVAYGDTVDVWVPFAFEGNPTGRGSHFLDCIGRLKQGVTSERAQAEMNDIMAQLGREHEGDRNWKVMVIPLKQEITGRSQRLLWVLLGAAGALLIIACVNAANLLLARASIRQREMALRSALGARKSRLVRQMLTESLLISVTGAVLGCLLAVGGVRALVSLLPADFPRIGDIHVNAVMFLFALLVSVATGVLFGLAPALQSSNTDLVKPLREGGRSSTGSSCARRLRNGLVVCEIALACLLVIGAGLMLRSFVNLLRTDPGFRPQKVLTASISLPAARYKTPEAVSLFYAKLARQLGSAQGIRSAAIGSDLPWTGYDDNAGGFQVEGETPPAGQFFHARYHTASPDYFRVLGIPLVRGRYFSEHDTKDAASALIINRAMALRYWRSENVVGRRMTFEDKAKEKDWMTIVGVVGDVKDTPANDSAEPAFWWPISQVPFGSSQMAIVLSGNSDMTSMANQLRATVQGLDPSLAVAEIKPMEKVAGNSYATSRFALFLTGLFAVLALALAAIGTYGILSYSVNQRRHEFGIRMALGASSAEVLRTVVSDGMKLAVMGTVVGVGCGLALGRLVASLLYGVRASDPVTIGAACVVLATASALACYVPARRATRNDPMHVLRSE